ncbi:MAG: glycosidase [Tenericutes bacterium HGW-Tenericutes-2]|jgi:beta-xylosidase|nr:MAG: glycosidase [Tenericutes bacterium HGW-Tenericutes-2]
MIIKNPIGITNIGDPFVLKHDNMYYLYATSFIDGFNCYTSTDLMNWSKPVQVYKKSERSFGYKDFWAPEVIFQNNHFIMHYSARWSKNHSLRIGVAISSSPLGPFVDVYDQEPMFDDHYAVIDGHVFIDDDGKKYFYYNRDCSEYIYNENHESHIYVAEMDETYTKRITSPILIAKPEQPWELKTGDWRWNEGAFVFKRKDLYYLMFSSGFYASETYSIGYAISKNPLGPFMKAKENPILKTIPGKVSGPGHNSVIVGPDNQLYCIYHVHTFINEPSQNRQVFIDKISFNNDKLVIEGPTLGKDESHE